MRIGDRVQVGVALQRLVDLPTYLLARAAGRSVLNIGAAGGVTRYLPQHINQWFHARLTEIAAEVVGVDLDSKGIAHAARHGWTITLADCETMALNRMFDLALMIDVIEHVEAPARCIANVLRHLGPNGRLYISTPNPAFIGDIARAVCGRQASIYWDHQALFAPEHLQAICDRHGFALTEVHLFSHRDQRTTATRWKSEIIAKLGRLNPRLNSSWLGVVEARMQ